MKTAEELAEIFYTTGRNGMGKDSSCFPTWEEVSDKNKANYTAAMQASLDALFASVDGVPDYSATYDAFLAGRDNGSCGAERDKNGLEAVRNLFLPIIAAKEAQVKGLEQKLEAAAKLEPQEPEAKPEKWAAEKAAWQQGQVVMKNLINEPDFGWEPVHNVDEFDQDGWQFHIMPGMAAAQPEIAEKKPAEADTMTLALLHQQEKQRAEKAEQRAQELEAELAQARTAWERQHSFNAAEIMAAEQRVKELEEANDGLLEEVKKACSSSQAFEKEAKRWQFQHPEVQELKSRLALLTPRPVSVKPTAEDANSDGSVILMYEDGSSGLFAWDNIRESDGSDARWLPGNLDKLCPDLLPKTETAEERERRECAEWFMNEFKAEHGDMPPQRIAEQAWLARAGKEGK